MTRFFLACWLCFGGTFPPFHLSTFPLQKHLSTFKDPVIRILSIFSSSTSPRHNVSTIFPARVHLFQDRLQAIFQTICCDLKNKA
jgi:hypothetical protein